MDDKERNWKLEMIGLRRNCSKNPKDTGVLKRENSGEDWGW